MRTVQRLVSVESVASSARAADALTVPLTTKVFCDQPAVVSRSESRPTAAMPLAIGIR